MKIFFVFLIKILYLPLKELKLVAKGISIKGFNSFKVSKITTQ